MEHRQLHDDLVRRSDHDALTGLPNRALLDRRMDEALERARLDKNSIAVGFIDLDGFKLINDRMGHEIGDLYLKRAAGCFRECLPASGTLARIGGDEFVFMLPGIGEEKELREIGRRLIDSLSQPFRFGQLDARASCSIGVAVFPQDGADSDELRRRADEAMYFAKTNGKGQVFLYGECIHRDRRRSATTASIASLEAATKRTLPAVITEILP
jgi:diguanylate cyclase (GGDEF)-like protein